MDVLIKKLCCSKSEGISYQEFLMAGFDKSIDSIRKKIDYIFKNLDTDGCSAISKEDLERLLGHSTSAQDIVEMIQDAHYGGDDGCKVITKDELIDFLIKNSVDSRRGSLNDPSNTTSKNGPPSYQNQPESLNHTNLNHDTRNTQPSLRQTKLKDHNYLGSIKSYDG